MVNNIKAALDVNKNNGPSGATRKDDVALDALLIVPPKKHQLCYPSREHAGINFLAAALRAADFKAKIIDAELSAMDIEQTVSIIASKPNRIIGITFITDRFETIEVLIQHIRAEGINSLIILGGNFPTFRYKEILTVWPEVDCVAIGEGEQTIVALVTAVRQGSDWRKVQGLAYRSGHRIKANPTHPLIDDLNALPFQARDTLGLALQQPDGGAAVIVGSRGCYGNCSFCSVREFYRQAKGPCWRGRSPINIVDEIASLVIKGVGFIIFNDDNFFGPGKRGRRRAYDLADEIIRRRLNITFHIAVRANDVEIELFRQLKKAGLFSVFIGIESMADSDLKLYNKHISVSKNAEAIAILDRLGIDFYLGLITVNPESTLHSIKLNLRFFRDNIINSVFNRSTNFISELRLLSGTKLETKFIRKKDAWYKDFGGCISSGYDPKVYQLMQRIFGLENELFKIMTDYYVQLAAEKGWKSDSPPRWLISATAAIVLDTGLKLIHILESGEISSDEENDLDDYVNERTNDLKLKINIATE